MELKISNAFSWWFRVTYKAVRAFVSLHSFASGMIFTCFIHWNICDNNIIHESGNLEQKSFLYPAFESVAIFLPEMMGEA